jgi:hypothetical protein
MFYSASYKDLKFRVVLACRHNSPVACCCLINQCSFNRSPSPAGNNNANGSENEAVTSH